MKIEYHHNSGFDDNPDDQGKSADALVADRNIRPPSMCDFDHSELLQPFRLAARVQLLWMLVEDALRREVSYSARLADRWHENLGKLSASIGPLELSVASIPHPVPTIRSRLALLFFREHLTGALRQLKSVERSPINRIFSALNGVYRARLGLLDLCESLRTLHLGVTDYSHVTGGPHCLVGSGYGIDLVGAYEELLDAMVTHDGDDSEQCQASRQFYLALYQTMVFDKPGARILYRPSLVAHERLLSRMPHGLARECVRARYKIMATLGPDRFEAEALRLAELSGENRFPNVRLGGHLGNRSGAGRTGGAGSNDHGLDK